jgi:hypothetical protein
VSTASGGWLGIDFSGNAESWRPGSARNVWVAEAGGGPDDPVLLSLRPVQRLEGKGEPYQRLVDRLRSRDFAAAGIDAPFSIPAAYLPEGGRRALLEKVDRLPLETGRPFPRKEQLVSIIADQSPRREAKPLRTTERAWRVNARSTLWTGPRGGAAFTAACLKLIARTGLGCWPWVPNGEALLVEAFPAAQLKAWRLHHQGYGDKTPEQVAVRRSIVGALRARICCQPDALEEMYRRADALDAVLCCFAAIAVTESRLATPIPATAGEEGWIAVHV